MKKTLITCSTALLLMMSSQAIAFDDLSYRDQKRISTEVHELKSFLSLSQTDADKIIQYKADMAKANAQLIQEHGRGTDAFKEARKPHFRAYQKNLQSIVSREDLRRFNASKS
ncbi:hypothetical protein L4D13_15850 [Photobacterium profundum]|uniref:hypothetical protein n=1 Tax=Photobacterium profundum TaxID=74109 RepID=UPI003D0AD6DE